MRKVITALTLILVASVCANAQIDEVGFSLGGLSYTGDLDRGYSLLQNKPAGSLYIRTNTSDHISWRYSVTGGRIGASDLQTPVDPFATQRGASFTRTLIEISTVVEYHFLDFKTENTLIRWSPYFFGGAALMIMAGGPPKVRPYSSFQPAIPLGVGLKYVLNPKWMVGAEFGTRRLFFDYLDNVSEGDLNRKNFQYGNWFENDSYYFLGFSLTYAFYRIPCPFPYQ